MTIPGITRNGGESFTVDVTSLTSSFGGSAFLGVRFELLDSQLNQKALLASSIVLTEIPEPAAGPLGLMGAGMLLLGHVRKIYRQQ